MNPDGSGLRQVAENASAASPPVWSPDGQKITFNGPDGAHVVNADGTGLQKLTNGGVSAWSPDGQTIAFVRTVGTLPQWTRNGPNSEIFVMNAGGGGLQNLTRNPKPDTAPAWSPDGQKIAFRRSFGARCGPMGCGGGRSDLYVMSADGSGQRNLTRNPSVDMGGEARHAWSPDGQKIAFQRRAKGENWEIFVVNADGSGLRNLTRNRSHDIDADWSPDGQRIVFRTSRHGRWELYVMNADGSGQRSLTRTPTVSVSRPSWSPDGQQIAFTRRVGGNFELYAMNADGSGLRKLTPNRSVDRWVTYAWSPARPR